MRKNWSFQNAKESKEGRDYLFETDGVTVGD